MQEISDKDAKRLSKKVKARVRRLLQLPDDKSEWNDKNHDDYTKYYRIFIATLYAEAKDMGIMGSSVGTTQRMFYEACQIFIDSWIPLRGVKGLKEYADEQRESKKRTA